MPDMPTDDHWMHLALEAARKGIAAGQTPFGAAIVRAGQPVVASHNQVWRDTDITAHAEIVAIRSACAILHTVDLSGCDIYCTCEPCPMCFAASHWARFGRIIYGASIPDAQAAGFNELTIPAQQMKSIGGNPAELRGGVLRDEAVQLFHEWLAHPAHRAY